MLISTLDIIGTIAFAVSGSLTAIHKRFDIFGISIIAICTALGGGTLRDMLIGNTPVFWMSATHYFYIVIASAFACAIFYKEIDGLKNPLLTFDTIGLGVFTLIGIEKGLQVGLDPLVCIILGTITGCFGGVIRDILCNTIPIIFKTEIYATACLIGGFVFFILDFFQLNPIAKDIITLGTILTVRFLAIRKHWSLPQVKA